MRYENKHDIVNEFLATDNRAKFEERISAFCPVDKSDAYVLYHRGLLNGNSPRKLTDYELEERLEWVHSKINSCNRNIVP